MRQVGDRDENREGVRFAFTVKCSRIDGLCVIAQRLGAFEANGSSTFLAGVVLPNARIRGPGVVCHRVA